MNYHTNKKKTSRQKILHYIYRCSGLTKFDKEQKKKNIKITLLWGKITQKDPFWVEKSLFFVFIFWYFFWKFWSTWKSHSISQWKSHPKKEIRKKKKPFWGSLLFSFLTNLTGLPWSLNFRKTWSLNFRKNLNRGLYFCINDKGEILYLTTQNTAVVQWVKVWKII